MSRHGADDRNALTCRNATRCQVASLHGTSGDSLIILWSQVRVLPAPLTLRPTRDTYFGLSRPDRFKRGGRWRR